MISLLRSTRAYRDMGGDVSHTTLVTFADETYLRPLLRECAKAFFHAGEGSREANLIEKEGYSDCIFLPEPKGKLTADACARILDESALRPVEGDKKLFVLDAFHSASALVQNKLLKVFEEPPEGVYFLLGTVNEHAVLPTVRSRARTEFVPPFPEEEIAAALLRKYPGRETGAAAAACGGIPSVAESLLSEGEELFSLAEEFLAGEDPAQFCRRLSDRKDGALFFASVRMVLRDAMFFSEGLGRYAARKNEGTVKLSKLYGAGAAIAGLSLVGEAQQELVFNANFPQCALNLAIKLKKERDKWHKSSS